MGGIGATSGQDFHRIVQIEESLTKVVKREFTKNGMSGVKKILKNKSRKYVKKYIVPQIFDALKDTFIKTGVNIII